MMLAYQLLVTETSLAWYLAGVFVFALLLGLAIGMALYAVGRLARDVWAWLHDALVDPPPTDLEAAERRRLDAIIVPFSKIGGGHGGR